MNVFDGILEVFYENMQNAQDNVWLLCTLCSYRTNENEKFHFCRGYSQEKKFKINTINEENCLSISKSNFVDKAIVCISIMSSDDLGVSEYVLSNKK